MYLQNVQSFRLRYTDASPGAIFNLFINLFIYYSRDVVSERESEREFVYPHNLLIYTIYTGSSGGRASWRLR